MRLRRVLLFVCLFACVITPLSSQPKKKKGSLSAFVTGTVPRTGAHAANVVGPAQPQQATSDLFTGVLNITNFVVQNGALMAVGTISGTVTDAAGNVINTFQDVPAALQVTGMTATCPILNLQLGPLGLNLLGLVVDLNDVLLNITAESGAGNLLGNLLCAVAGLLDGPAGAGLVQNVATLLNGMMAAL